MIPKLSIYTFTNAEPIFRGVITGGPCSGKSTALPYLQEQLENRGVIVAVVPEIATHLMESNIEPHSGRYDSMDFQKLIIQHSLFSEELRIQALQNIQDSRNRKKILLCDRGIMDGRAYCPYLDFRKTLKHCGIEDPVQARDKRYDAVFHMLTAADGAPSFYTCANNKNRKETPAEARLLDKKTQRAWLGHPHWKLIDNKTDFKEKCNRLLREICHSLGIPVPLEYERKYHVKAIGLRSLPVPYERLDIEQMYLLSADPGVEVRIRKRGQRNSWVYYLTYKTPHPSGARIETESFISLREYNTLASTSRDKNKHVVRKNRYCFVLDGYYIEYDRYRDRLQGLHTIEIEQSNLDDIFKLPAPLRVRLIKEVTNDKRFSNSSLATLSTPPSLK